MTVELLTQHIGIWITQYIAVFCLFTMLVWTVGAYVLVEHSEKTVRDSAVYLLALGILTLVLALRPAKTDIVLWAPITWFCFSMTLMLELLWISYLIEELTKVMQRSRHRSLQLPGDPPQIPTPYSRH